MTIYRTHTCGALTKQEIGKEVKLSGWVHSKRDHGNLMFIDLRDNYGLTQIVVDKDAPCFKDFEDIRIETVIQIDGTVLARAEGTLNPKLSTGEIEVAAGKVSILGASDVLPMQVNGDASDLSEEVRLKYRFLDLRRDKPHANILLRNQVMQTARTEMWAQGFSEFQTPILTASSPEGARDFLVPSRLHPGKFYALPQAPQQFKQLLMVSGFDKYFQIAPCFRDEDSRADRTPGEFYQLDMEMSFVEQDDIMNVMEPVIYNLMKKFTKKEINPYPWRRIDFNESMLMYGSDKPDLRNPLIIKDCTEVFDGSDFGIFAKMIADGAFARAIKVPACADKPRSFFDKLNDWARAEGFGGLAYISFTAEGAKGPVAKNLSADRLEQLKEICQVVDGDSVFFVCGKGLKTKKFSGIVRNRLGQEMGLIDENKFEFCWIVDFPFYEENEETGTVEFSHNPFSMPQGGLEALEQKNPLEIKAFQYDCVCNGLEMASGAIRNHSKEIMYKAFEIAGYGPEVVEEKFGGMLNAFKYGAPPHGGCAFGLDRIVMLLAEEDYIREVIAFPFNQKAEDLLMHAPAEVSEKQLREAHIKLRISDKKD